MKCFGKHIPRITGLGVLAALAVYIGGEKPQMRSMRNYMAGDVDGLTNRLHFTAIAVSSNAVAFSAAWPATNPPPPDGVRSVKA